MTDKQARDTLWRGFYTEVLSKANPPSHNSTGIILMFRRDNGELVLPDRVPASELQKRRDELIGKDFRFKIDWEHMGDQYRTQ